MANASGGDVLRCLMRRILLIASSAFYGLIVARATLVVSGVRDATWYPPASCCRCRLSAELRAQLALGRRNGFIAVSLALAYELHLPRALGVADAAVLVAHVLHIRSNKYWEVTRRARARLNGSGGFASIPATGR